LPFFIVSIWSKSAASLGYFSRSLRSRTPLGLAGSSGIAAADPQRLSEFGLPGLIHDAASQPHFDLSRGSTGMPSLLAGAGLEAAGFKGCGDYNSSRCRTAEKRRRPELYQPGLAIDPTSVRGLPGPPWRTQTRPAGRARQIMCELR